MKNSVVIIGYGVVGHNLAEEIGKVQPEVYDKYKEVDTRTKEKYDIGFICVDTPLVDGIVDITEVRNAVNDNDCDIYVLKSTVPVGTVDQLKEETGKHIIFSPEYYGGTQHCNNFTFDFTILGGAKEDCIKVQQLLQYCYDGRHVFRIVEPKIAELCKFMENSFLATKVFFCIQFYDMCEELGVSYEELRECFILDKRLGESHTFVYKDTPYFNSHCLNKDVPSIANQFNNKFLKFIVEENEKNKQK